MFVMNYTQPNIAYAVSRLSRYTHNPSSEYWNALHRLLRYLRGFCDANWVTDSDEVSSTSGYVFTLGAVFILGAGAISWKSSKQTCIARSTMKSKFIALELAGQEAE
ncbi:secreted RxLR effector protein 161-like [Lycium ferocissimum]|uniref:secreted RxLR effector protein 161-like n=1 Tax=Lycium ferocissimum TaxID=112874 RepID=UPI002815D105|nr:secreted RxLR effector protein 161-like [Lycium ferocissimum]